MDIDYTLSLPLETLKEIFSHLRDCDRVVASHVSSLWKSAVPECTGNVECDSYVDNLELLKWANENVSPHTHMTFRSALRGGYLDSFKWLAESGAYSLTSTISSKAAEKGHFHILKWLRGYEEGDPFPRAKPRCSWGEKTCSSASFGGHLHILKWLRGVEGEDGSPGSEIPCPWNCLVCTFAVSGAHMQILKWIREQGSSGSKTVCDYSRDTFFRAPISLITRHLEIFKWAFQNGCPVTETEMCRYKSQYPHIYQHIDT